MPRRWHELLDRDRGRRRRPGRAGSLVDADASAGAGTTAVVASFVLVVLAAGIWLQLVSGKTRSRSARDARSLLAAVGLALLLARPLFDVDRDRGFALAAAAVSGPPAGSRSASVQPSLALVARRLVSRRSPPSRRPTCCRERASRSPGRSRRCSSPGSPRGCATRACRLRRSSTAASRRRTCSSSMRRRGSIFDAPVPGMAAASVAALACALVGTGIARAGRDGGPHRGRPPRLARSRPVWLAAHRVGLQESLLLGGAAAGTYALAILLTAYSFRHRPSRGDDRRRAVSAPAPSPSPSRRGSVGPPRCVVRVGRRRLHDRDARFDVPEFAVEAVHRSYGGWALIAASAGLLAGCFAFQLLFRKARPRRSCRPPGACRARRLSGRNRAHLAGRRDRGVDLDRLAAARADARPRRARGERLPDPPPSRSRHGPVVARRRRAPRKRMARRARRHLAGSRLRRHRGRARAPRAAPSGASALARRLGRRRRAPGS